MWSLAPSILLLQAAADSAATRVVVERTWLDTVASVGLSLVALFVLIMLVLGVVLLFALKKSLDELTKLIRSAYEPLRGALAETRHVTGEVRAIVQSIKEPLALAGETIEDASDRVRAVMDVAEGRLARLDELVGIAQEQAEGAVIGAASFFRGVTAGGRSARRAFGRSSGKSAGKLSSRKARALARRRRAQAERALRADDDMLIDPSADEAPRIRTRVGEHR
ncbi:MAG: hypothetical protein ACLGIK_08780 [Gemmatimonadota bacterium]